MSAKNTNAGEGEAVAITGQQAALIAKLLEPIARASAAIGDELGPFRFETGKGYRDLSRNDLLSAARAHQLLAALSAQSTGSAGVAAEPVAWIWEERYDGNLWGANASPLKPARRTNIRDIRPLYEHPPVAAEPVGGLRQAAQAVLDAICADGPGVGEPGYPSDKAYNLDDRGEMRLTTGLVRALRDALAAAPTPPAGGGETAKPKSDGQIVAEVNALAAFMLSIQGTGYQAPEGFKFYNAPLSDIRAQRTWQHAVVAYEMITRTEVHDALLALEDDDALPVTPEHAPASPAGDLISLSAGDFGLLLQDILRQFARDVEASPVWPGMSVEEFNPRFEAMRDASGAIMAAASRLAPAAPRKGPTKEQIAQIVLRYIALDLKTPASMEAYSLAAADAILALTPADRGETQAVLAPPSRLID